MRLTLHFSSRAVRLTSEECTILVRHIISSQDGQHQFSEFDQIY